MTDIFSSTRRSEIMRSIKSKDTKPELLLRRYLHNLGFRFRLHKKQLPGTPDIVLKKYKTVIFVNGCFWHGHESCRRGTSLPKTKVEFWENKIKSNKERDKKKSELLKKLGWRVIIVYECDLTTKKIDNTLNRVQSLLKEPLVGF